MYKTHPSSIRNSLFLTSRLSNLMSAVSEFSNATDKQLQSVDMADNSSSSSSSSFLFLCAGSRVSINMSFACTAIRAILTLPPCALVLYLGHQRWRQQRSFKTTSHSDVFTYHMATMVLTWAFGCLCFFCGMTTNQVKILNLGICVSSVMLYGENFFHVLTCVERYLAVVHPIIYMKLKNTRGVRIRNISIGCVWLLSFGTMGFTAQALPDVPIVPLLCLLVFSFVVVSFCSLSVLRVIIRPGPGGGGRERVDQSKQRAFHTMTAILGVLGGWFAGLIVSLILFGSNVLSMNVRCMVMSSATLLNLPSSLLLPLLYLHRAGKLPRC